MIDIELDKAISAAMHAGGTGMTGIDPLPSAGNLLVAAEGGDGGGGNAFALDGIQNSNASYPEAFRVVADDPNGSSFRVNSPIVCNGSSVITATGGSGLGDGDYYCKVNRDSDGVVTAVIQSGESTDNDTVLIIPIATIDETGVKQHHVGAIVVPQGGGAGSTAKAAFDYVVSTDDEGVKSGSVVRCTFMWDGEVKSLPNFSASSGSVYLVAKQSSPSGGSGEASWEFEMSSSEGTAQEGGRVVNYKLYEIDDFSVVCDYRTTFLELKSPHRVARFVTAKYDDPTSSVTLDASTDSEASVKAETESTSATLSADSTTAKLELEGSEKTVTLDPSDLSQDGGAQFHKLTVKHADGEETEYDVLSDRDIEIVEADAEERLTDVEIELYNTTLRIKKTFTDKDGNTRDEYSTGITVKQTDVVTGSSYSSALKTFKNAKIKAIVLDTESGTAEDVFVAVPHSENS